MSEQHSTPDVPARTHWFQRAEGLALAIVGLWAVAFQLWLPSTHVQDSDYQAVAQVLEAERRPGDVVLLAPWWTERARQFVPPGLPVVGYLGSESDALDRHNRIWVLSQPHLPRAEISAFQKAFLPGRTSTSAQRSFGNLTLELFSNGRFRVTTVDLAASLQGARAYLEAPDGVQQACEWSGSGYRCPRGKIALEWREVHFRPYQCIRMEPPGGGTRVMLELSAPDSAERTELEAGYIWEYGAYREGVTPSRLWLEINGKEQTMELPVGDERMHRIDGPLLVRGDRIRVGLLSENPNARVVCVLMRGTRGTP